MGAVACAMPAALSEAHWMRLGQVWSHVVIKTPCLMGGG